MSTERTAVAAQAERVSAAARVWAALLALCFLGLLGRVLYMKVSPDPRLAETSGSPYSSMRELGRRGDLVDRAGRIIATSSVGYRLFVDPHEVDDLQTVAVEIAHVIGGDPVDYDQKIIERQHTRFVVLNQLLSDAQVEAVRGAGIRGVGLEPRLVREYADDAIGGVLIGKVGFEHSGQGGMEHRFEPRLAPEDGRLTYLRDARGEPLWIEPSGYVPSADGEHVRLSLDLAIQEIAERHVLATVEKYNAGGGRMIVADPVTGEILAMVDILRERAGWDEFTTDPARATHPSLGRNRCATDPYEPGSTFKPFIWASITEMGRARIDEVMPTPSVGPYHTSRGRKIRDAHYYGPSSWERVLVKSMNSGMAYAAERLTHGEMQNVLRAWGFGRRTGTGIPGESPGIITPPKRWNHHSQTSVAYGHELCVTPLQMVQAFSAFCRDGTMPDLRLTAVDDRRAYVPVLRRAVNEDTAILTRGIMRKVMLEGTGQRAQSERYQIFGKSGTAQLPKKDGGGYHENRYVSSFVGAAPLDAPRVVVLCVIDDPDRKKGHYGGEVAGPCVRDVIDETLGYLGVVPDLVQPVNSGGLASVAE